MAAIAPKYLLFLILSLNLSITILFWNITRPHIEKVPLSPLNICKLLQYNFLIFLFSRGIKNSRAK